MGATAARLSKAPPEPVHPVPFFLTPPVFLLPDSAGAQGGSVARALLESKKFAVRALSRDVSQPRALALRDLGAEVVRGGLNSEESVEAALKGAYGVFLVTNFWDHRSKEEEVRQVETHCFLFPCGAFLLTLPRHCPPWRDGEKYKP